MSQDFLPQIRTENAVLFPAPEDGERLEITPPPMYWLQVEGASEYRVVVENAGGETVVDETIGRNFLILRRPLPPGNYRWNIYADGRQRGWYAFEIAPDALEHIVPTADEVLARIPGTHPRHLYYPEDIETIVARYPGEIEVLRRNIRAAVEQGMPPRPRFHRTDGGYGGHPRYREAFGDYRDYVDRNLIACALGHLLLRDSDAADYARSAFLNIIDWNPEGPCAVDGQWSDEIGLSNTRCLFAAYDWTFDLYTEEQHRYIRATLAQYARQILRLLVRRNFFNDPGNNHSGRIPAYLGEAVLVLHGHIDPAETRQWLQIALDVYGSFFPYYGGRDGGWAQGTFYGSSYTKWYLPFFFAVERHTGFSFLDRPFYWKVSHFFMHLAPPGWEIHPFCDGYWCLPEDEEWPGFFAQDPYGVYAERFGPDVARKFYAMTPLPELFKLHLMDIFRVPFQSRRPDAAGPASQSRAFRDAGFVSIHGKIEDPEQDTAVLIRASKYGTQSHMHADQGGFAVISRGKGLISPTGYFGRGGGTDHHRLWTLQTHAHNCILVDGEGQPARSIRTIGRIECLKEEGPYAFTSLDLGGAYPQLAAYRRRIFFLRPGLILVYDDLKAKEEVRYSWLAHTLSPPEVEGDGIAVRRDPASLRIHLVTGGAETPDFTWTDRFGVGINDNVPEHVHRDHPAQYHLTWIAAPVKDRRFVAIIPINGAGVQIHRTDGELSVGYNGRKIDFVLNPDGPDRVILDGRAIVDRGIDN